MLDGKIAYQIRPQIVYLFRETHFMSFYNIFEKNGIKKHIKNHIFRKSFVTHLIERGADLAMVSDAARHRDVRTTLRFYAAVNKERSKDIHQEIMNLTLDKVDNENSQP